MSAGVLAMLCGCAITPIDTAHRPPPDWPALAVSVHYIHGDLAKTCGLQSSLSPLVGCATADFNRGTCSIYLNFHSDTVLAHELLHCQGYDHPGETTFHASWARFKRARAAVALRTASPSPGS
jgi:hypothetical protein